MAAIVLNVRTDRGEERLDLEEFENRVVRGEIAPQCPVLFPVVTGERWVEAGTLEIFKQNYSPRRLHFSNAFRLGGFPKVTTAFIALNVFWFLAMQHYPRGSSEDTLLAFGAKAGPLLLDVGQIWRLFTANLVHKDALHIAVNLFVLFNFAGALENAFRPWDTALVLAFSAIGTTLCSFAVSDPISAGASGVAYGALGGAVVFGFKYREILPPRYRRILGGAVVPTVLVFLFIGWTSSGVDNWGHLGGLGAGMATVAFLRPRLLSDPPSRRQLIVGRVLPLAALGLALLGFGPLSRDLLPRLTPELSDELGLSVSVPSEWDRGAARLGGMTFFNGLSGYGHAHLSAGGILSEGAPDLPLISSQLVQKELSEPQQDGRLEVDALSATHPTALAGLTGLETDGRFTREGETFEVQFLVLRRGRLCYLLELVWPTAIPRYGELFAKLRDRVRVVEPAFVRRARAQRLFAPASAEARQELDEAEAAIEGAG